MAVTRVAIDDAELVLSRDVRDDVGLFVGSMFGAASWASVDASDESDDEKQGGDAKVHAFTQITANAPAGVVCQTLGIRGPTTTIAGGTAGTIALEAAVEAIRLGRSDVILVVAAEETSGPKQSTYKAIGGLAADKQAHPYEAGHPGTECGIAAVALVVESAASARAAGRAGYCSVAGIAHSADNYHEYRFDGGGASYAAALQTSLDRAGRSAADVDLVLASANGTDLDEAETNALKRVFPTPLPVFSPKRLTAECDAASGLVNVALAALALRSTDPALSDTTVALCPNPLADHNWAPQSVDAAVATSATFGAAFGSVVLERRTS